MKIEPLIKDPIVLFLGAGASQPYGLPLGSELHQAIIADNNSNLSTIIEELGLNHAQFKKFQESLKYTDHKTIDTFLTHKSNFREIGSVAIAISIMKRENNDILFNKTDWYQNLFKSLKFEEEYPSVSNFSIVTLNYDRSFEHYFNKAIEYNCKYSLEKKAKSKFQKIKIVHPHGMIGRYPKINYGTKPNNIQALKEAAKNIKIVSDSIDGTYEYEQSIKLLQSANTIIFLGFGYDENILNKYFNNINFENKNIFGTAMNIKPERQQNIAKYFQNKISFDKVNYNCDSYLRSIRVIN